MRPEIITCPELEAARRFAPEIAARAREFEDARKLAPEIVQRFVDDGLVDMAVPTAYGGRESHPLDIVRVIEEISYGDASAGWCLMNYQTTALVSGILSKRWGEEIFGGSVRCCPAGVLAPTSRAYFVDGGMVVTGRWAYGSGCDNANWLLATAVMYNDDDTPRTNPDGSPEILLPLLSRDQFTILDTWYVSGLCASGSHDVEVKDAFVPDGRWVTLADPPLFDGPLFRFPIATLFPPTVVAVSIGIARAAFDSFVELATDKVPAWKKSHLAEQTSAQIDVAHAEANIDSARSYVFETVEALWDEILQGQEPSTDARRRTRLASTYACEAATAAVDLLYRAGGGSSIYDDNPLQRYFRDIHATSQHVQIGHVGFENMGRLRLTGELQGPF